MREDSSWSQEIIACSLSLSTFRCFY